MDILRFCENKIKERLEKYDVLLLSKGISISAEFNDWLKNAKQALQKDCSGYSSIEVTRQLIQKRYVEPNSQSVQLFQAMSGIQIAAPFFIGRKIPGEIKEMYTVFWKAVSLFINKGNGWYIYRKDVLRAIAYHDWVQALHLSETNIEIVRSAEITPERYKNVPVWPTIQVEQSKYGAKEAHVFLSIGGGILDKQFWKQPYLQNLFLRCNDEYDEAGNMEGTSSLETKAKGVPYKKLRQVIQEIDKKNQTAADLWFLKNTLDQEIIIGMCEIIGKRNVIQEDYKLIWLLCKCRPASTRLYLLEAIKPVYGYSATYLRERVSRKQRETIFASLFDLLDEMIEKINQIFTEMVLEVSDILEAQEVSAAEFYESEDVLAKSFQLGDDFPFMEHSEKMRQSKNEKWFVNIDGEVEYIGMSENGEENNIISIRDGDEAKSYSDYLPEKTRTNTGTPDRISYAVITALNKQWRKRDVENGVNFQSDIRKADDEEIYENVIERLQQFPERLQWFLLRKV